MTQLEDRLELAYCSKNPEGKSHHWIFDSQDKSYRDPRGKCVVDGRCKYCKAETVGVVWEEGNDYFDSRERIARPLDNIRIVPSDEEEY